MTWERGRKKDSESIIEFIKTMEPCCLAFSSNLVRNGMPASRNGWGGTLLINKEETSPGRIAEAVFLSDYGLVVPMLRTCNELPEREHLSRLLRKHANRVHSIIGFRDQVQMLEPLVNCIRIDHVEYHYMILSAPIGSEPVAGFSDLSIRRAGIKDAKHIFPLQKAYEIEEVLLNPQNFNPSASFAMLEQTLKKEIVYIAELSGIPVAKASTNALGFSLAQIGGVYTAKEFRNRGICSLLMRILTRDIFCLSKTPCLFVKKNNPAAIRLYKKLGFSISTDFRIVYYSC